MLISGTTGIDLTGLPINNSGNTEVEGNLNLSGVGKRITGDFSNATFSDRVAFQTSTPNGNTIVSVIPNGTGTSGSLDIYNSNSMDTKTQIGCNPSESFIRASQNSGTNTYLPMTFIVGGPERMRIDTAGNVGIGISSPTEKLHLYNGSASNTLLKTVNSLCSALFGVDNAGFLYAWSSDAAAAYVGTSKATGVTNFYSGGGQKAQLDASGNLVIGASSPTSQRYISINGGNTGVGDGAFYKVMNNDGNICALGNYSSIVGGTYDSTATLWSNNSLKFITSGGANVRATLDNSGNLLLTSGTGGLGYGTGAGGTVTQLTSKSTAVTLNKPSGEILTHNAALAAGASVTFILYNSLVGAYDTSIATARNGNYDVKTTVTVSGVIYIKVTNVSGGSLSDSVPINFAVIKGAVA